MHRFKKNSNVESEFGVESYYHLNLVGTSKILKYAGYKVKKKIIIYLKIFYVVVTEHGYRLPTHKILRKTQCWDRATQPHTTKHHYHLNLGKLLNTVNHILIALSLEKKASKVIAAAVRDWKRYRRDVLDTTAQHELKV